MGKQAVEEISETQGPESFKRWLLGDPESEDEGKQIGLLNLRGFSIRNVAREAKISAASIYGYIAGHKRPTPNNLHRLCKALDVPYQEGLKHIKPSKMGRPFKTGN